MAARYDLKAWEPDPERIMARDVAAGDRVLDRNQFLYVHSVERHGKNVTIEYMKLGVRRSFTVPGSKRLIVSRASIADARDGLG